MDGDVISPSIMVVMRYVLFVVEWLLCLYVRQIRDDKDDVSSALLVCVLVCLWCSCGVVCVRVRPRHTYTVVFLEDLDIFRYLIYNISKGKETPGFAFAL